MKPNRSLGFARVFVGLALSLLLAPAFAARGLPVAEFYDIPVAPSTPTALTEDQVRAVVTAAALASAWDVEPMGAGALRVTLLYDLQYKLVLLVKFNAAKYSVTYESSANLDFKTGGQAFLAGSTSLADYARTWRETRSALLPEFRFAVDRSETMIHPSAEQWTYELLMSVRRHLRAFRGDARIPK